MPPPMLSDVFALPVHGGDLGAAEARFGRPSREWLDLSTGISPFPYPLPDLQQASHRLPDSGAEAALNAAAAAHYGVVDVNRVVAAPGCQSLIQLLPRLRPYCHVAVISPTYREHAEAWSAMGHQVLPCETLDRIGDAEVVVVVNPNNPDGRHHDLSRLVEIAERLAARGGLMVVDEAFADTVPDQSLASRTRSGLLVLRSFGKFFGLAGLRLGFAICEPTLARQLRTALGLWPISGPALAVGRAALADQAWIEAARRKLIDEAQRLDQVLHGAQLSVAGGTHLFRLVNAPRAWALYEHLGQRGVLVRPFAAAPRWLRFGLPPGEEGRARLQEALADWPG